MKIDSTAPVVAKDTILIHAPVEAVWAIQTDLEKWPTWQPDIQEVKLEGDLKQGAVFRWKAQGLKITSTLQTVEIFRQIGWTGISLGMRANHIWRFQNTPEGTLVTTEESLSGWLTRLLAFFDKDFLVKSMANSLAILKAQAEQAS